MEMEVDDWKPIETAPEETAVLVYVTEGVMAVGRRSVYSDRSTWWLDNSFGYNEDGEIYGPTHWMPLPEPPQPE